MKLERRVDPFFRPALDALLREPLAALVQALINLRRRNEGLRLAEEKLLPGEEAFLDSIIADMAAYMRAHYAPGEFQRAGNTKTHGIVRGEFIVRDDVPPEWRHGVFAEPRTFRAWVRFAGPGPASPPDIEEVGVLEHRRQADGRAGAEAPRRRALHPGLHGHQRARPSPRRTSGRTRSSRRPACKGTPLFYFINPFDSHLLDGVMQGLWARTQTSPLETAVLGLRPVPPRRGPRHAVLLPAPAPDPEPRAAPAAAARPTTTSARRWRRTLARQDVEFDFLVQLQTDAHRMPIENASVRWPERLSRPVPVADPAAPAPDVRHPGAARVRPQPVLQSLALRPRAPPAREPEPARRRLYWELSRLRQSMNATPHREPTGDEVFELGADGQAPKLVR